MRCKTNPKIRDNHARVHYFNFPNFNCPTKGCFLPFPVWPPQTPSSPLPGGVWPPPLPASSYGPVSPSPAPQMSSSTSQESTAASQRASPLHPDVKKEEGWFKPQHLDVKQNNFQQPFHFAPYLFNNRAPLGLPEGVSVLVVASLFLLLCLLLQVLLSALLHVLKVHLDPARMPGRLCWNHPHQDCVIALLESKIIQGSERGICYSEGMMKYRPHCQVPFKVFSSYKGSNTLTIQ